MTTPSAIIIAGLAIASAVLFSGWKAPRYQVAPGPIHGTAWVLDTSTGTLEQIVGKDITVVRP